MLKLKNIYIYFQLHTGTDNKVAQTDKTKHYAIRTVANFLFIKYCQPKKATLFKCYSSSIIRSERTPRMKTGMHTFDTLQILIQELRQESPLTTKMSCNA